MAPEKKSLWQQVAAFIGLVAFLVGIGIAWQATQGAIGVHDEKIMRIEQTQSRQWQKVNMSERKVDEISINLRVLMRSQGLEYQRVDE